MYRQSIAPAPATGRHRHTPSHHVPTTNTRRRWAYTVLLALFSVATLPQASAQRDFTADSIAFVNADWHTDTLDGFFFKHHHFMHRQVFNSNQCFSIIEIPSGSTSYLTFAADSTLTTVSLRINGKELGENTPSSTDSIHRKYYQNAIIRLLSTRRPRFVLPDSSRIAERLMADSNLMTAGPMLIQRGIDVPQRLDRSFVYRRHNRTAMGLKPDGTVVMLVVDGRHRGEAEGLSLPELTRIMRWLGCRDAVNLDGGGSSTMYIRDRGSDGIVNNPSDNGRFDPSGQRRVANAILVVKRR